MATTKVTAKKDAGKVDKKFAPGELMGASIRFGGGAGVDGCSVEYDHAPEAPKKGEGGADAPMGYYQPHKPDFFGSIEEACHAIVQAKGGASELQYEEAAEDKGKKADEKAA